MSSRAMYEADPRLVTSFSVNTMRQPNPPAQISAQATARSQVDSANSDTRPTTVGRTSASPNQTHGGPLAETSREDGIDTIGGPKEGTPGQVGAPGCGIEAVSSIGHADPAPAVAPPVEAGTPGQAELDDWEAGAGHSIEEALVAPVGPVGGQAAGADDPASAPPGVPAP